MKTKTIVVATCFAFMGCANAQMYDIQTPEQRRVQDAIDKKVYAKVQQIWAKLKADEIKQHAIHADHMTQMIAAQREDINRLNYEAFRESMAAVKEIVDVQISKECR